jgi:DNA modification methylase
MTESTAWKNRIVGSGEEAPDQILANPDNWRIHPEQQQRALTGTLEDIGLIQQVIVNQRTGRLIDGHLRVTLALRSGQPTLPVLYVDLSESEERLALASLDTITGLAATDSAALQRLIGGITTDNQAVQELLDYMSAQFEQAGRGEEEQQAQARASLAEQFLVPPFSVLDARQGYWRDRKTAWRHLGISAEEGRDAPCLPAIGGMADTSLFDPVLAELVVSWFSPPGGDVLDPFAGESTKGIVTSYLGRNYTGIELRPEQIAANQKQARMIGVKPNWQQGDSANLDRIVNGEFDLVFTSPPYYNLEEYGGGGKDGSSLGSYDSFREWHRSIMHAAARKLRPGGFLVTKVGDIRDSAGAYRNFTGHTVQDLTDAGLHLWNEAILVTAIGTLPIRAGQPFRGSRKLGKGHQNVIIMSNDTKRAQRQLDSLADALAAEFERAQQLQALHEKIIICTQGEPRADWSVITPPEGTV